MKNKNYQGVIDFFINRYKNGFKLDDEEYTFGEILDYLFTKLATAENDKEELAEWKKHLYKVFDETLIKKREGDTEDDIKRYELINRVTIHLVSCIDAYKSIEMGEREDIYK